MKLCFLSFLKDEEGITNAAFDHQALRKYQYNQLIEIDNNIVDGQVQAAIESIRQKRHHPVINMDDLFSLIKHLELYPGLVCAASVQNLLRPEALLKCSQ